jgi:hypothetical protein
MSSGNTDKPIQIHAVSIQFNPVTRELTLSSTQHIKIAQVVVLGHIIPLSSMNMDQSTGWPIYSNIYEIPEDLDEVTTSSWFGDQLADFQRRNDMVPDCSSPPQYIDPSDASS